MSGSGFAKELLDNTPPGLVDRLVKRVDRLLKPSFWQPNEFAGREGEESYTDPHVFAQFLPIDRLIDRTGPDNDSGSPTDAGRDPTKDRPVVRIFHDAGKMMGFQDIIVTVSMVFEGWYDGPDNQGWRIPMLMAWQVAADLCKTHKEGAYRINIVNTGSEPWLKWQIPDELTQPYWRVQLDTVWTGPAPAQFDMTHMIKATDSEIIKYTDSEVE